MSAALEPRNLYRLPWSLTDNGISWLEVTNKCNLACEGCYRDQRGGGHKSLGEIAADLDVFRRHRQSDCMSIAGGDPLVHPRIVEIVAMVKAGGWKPILNTNGLALTPELLRDLKRAGVFGFTFHVDASQVRPDSHATCEREHNSLRQKLAEMVAAEGNIGCAFNQTVNAKTLAEVPDVVRWARKRPDLVHSVVFILYRQPFMMGAYDYFVGDRRIVPRESYEDCTWGGSNRVTATDVVRTIREAEPEYWPCAYLNGTEDPNSFKWLLAMRAAAGERTFGFFSPRFMEAAQTTNHFLRRRWLAYCSPKELRCGLSAALLLAPFDHRMRGIAWRWFGSALRRPSLWLRPVHLQTFAIIQPIDVLPDGRMNMCDGCPDLTVYEGRLYWSCRLEEIKNWGQFMTAVPQRARAGEEARSGEDGGGHEERAPVLTELGAMPVEAHGHQAGEHDPAEVQEPVVPS